MEKEKVALVTGGTSGFGNALVKELMERGWKVATFGRRAVLIDRLKLESDGERLLADSCDMRLDNHMSRFIGKVTEKWRGLDLLVLNAGVLGPSPLPRVSELGLMELRSIMESNFFANFNMIRHCIPLMNNPSLVVHITSDAAYNSYPGWGGYSSSKIAMDQLIRTLNEEESMEFLSFDPGDMDTSMHRDALPEDDPDGLKKPSESAVEFCDMIGEKFRWSE